MCLLCHMKTIQPSIFLSGLCILGAMLSTIATSSAQTQNELPPKVRHAEPLYLDLVRDLGARKGEKEINVGIDFMNVRNYNQHVILAEYEFAPINRLGLEVETDFSFFKRTAEGEEVPNNKLECLRLSAQYSFWVSEKHRLTLAAGYTQIFEFPDFKNYGKSNAITGVGYNPFFVAAKRLGKNIHTLVYTSPVVEHDVLQRTTQVKWQINTAVHYSIPQTSHLIGIEINKEIEHGMFEMTVRPQVKIKCSKNLSLGLVAGIPVVRKHEHFSSFIRLIYEL